MESYQVWIPGDMNEDGQVNGLDVDPFVNAVLSEPLNPYGDMTGDGVVTGLDVDAFVAALVGSGGAQAVPEPSTLFFALVAMTLACVSRRWATSPRVVRRLASVAAVSCALTALLITTPATEVVRWMDAETYFSAEVTVDVGLADRVIAETVAASVNGSKDRRLSSAKARIAAAHRRRQLDLAKMRAGLS